MAVKVPCPNPACQSFSQFDERQYGHWIVCAHCGHRFMLEESTEGSTPRCELDARELSTLGEGGVAQPSSERVTHPVQVGRFVIHRPLGSGAFGTVYHAYDPQLDRDVAVKIPHSGTLETPGAIERFLREGRSAAKLRHAHIVPVYDANHDGQYYFIASAYIPGTTLLEELSGGPLPTRRCATLARDLAEALEHAHEHGVIHRDVKPSNILIDIKGMALLTDFGLAQQRGIGGSNLTYVGTIMGTPGYMSPEMAAGIQGELPPASDQYSLGVVLYEMLCGRRPFLGPSHVVLYHKIESDPPPPRLHHPAIPPALEQICMRAMARKPEGRYSSCAAMSAELNHWLEKSATQLNLTPPSTTVEVSTTSVSDDPWPQKSRQGKQWRKKHNTSRIRKKSRSYSPLWTVALSMSIWMILVVAIILLARILSS